MDAIELYKRLETEFTMGSPKSKLNRICKNSEDNSLCYERIRKIKSKRG